MNRNLTKNFQAVFVIAALILFLIVFPCDFSGSWKYSSKSLQTVIESVQQKEPVGKIQYSLHFPSFKQQKALSFFCSATPLTWQTKLKFEINNYYTAYLKHQKNHSISSKGVLWFIKKKNILCPSSDDEVPGRDIC